MYEFPSPYVQVTYERVIVVATTMGSSCNWNEEVAVSGRKVVLQMIAMETTT